MPRSISRAAVLAAFLAVMFATPVGAHSELVSATPGPDEEVVAPVELVARFSQDLDPTRTSLEVRDDGGNTVAKGGEPGADPREYRLELPDLAPGVYQVRYTTFSAEDGELFREPNAFSFTVVAAPSPTPSPSPTPEVSPTPGPSATPTASPTPETPAPSPSSSPEPTPAGGDAGAAIIPIAVALAVVAGLGLWLIRRRPA